jgi:hypothetical protein
VSPFIIPGEETLLNQINDSGTIVGDMFPFYGGGQVSAISINATGSVKTVLTPGQANGISNSGQITGFGYNAGFVSSIGM